MSLLFENGYRPNVCIVLCNQNNQVMLFNRIHGNGWQFPQGGIDKGEKPIDAMYRELYEETGLEKEQIKIIMRTKNWITYNIPRKWLRSSSRGALNGQKQIWFLCQLLVSTDYVNFATTNHPEFSDWEWTDYWEPINRIVEFKKSVYQRALIELSQYMPAGAVPMNKLFPPAPHRKINYPKQLKKKNKVKKVFYLQSI